MRSSYLEFPSYLKAIILGIPKVPAFNKLGKCKTKLYVVHG